jgi:ATP-dependent protease ClpP protease subunit
MTIHPVRTSGLVLGVPQAFDYLNKMQNRIVNFVVEHSRISENYLRTLMCETEVLANDIGSIIDGYEACRCGLIDEVGGIKDAIKYLYGRMERNE